MDNQDSEPMDLQGATAAIAGLMGEPKQPEQEDATQEAPQEDAAPEADAPDAPEQESEDPQAEAKYEVKVNGESRYVTLQEALKGFMMQEDYTRKTQQLAEERHIAEQRIRSEVSQAYGQQLQQLNAMLAAAIKQDQQIDWGELAQNDPAQYVQKMHEAQQRQLALQQLQAQQSQEAERNLAETLSHEKAKLLERRPEWSDSKKAQEDFAAMRGYLAKDYGFSEQEVNGITDHRHLDIVWKASQYDKLQAAKPLVTKKVEKLPVKLERPGVASDGKGNKSATERLRRSGKVEDAASAIAGLLR